MARSRVFTIGPYTYIYTVFPDGTQILKLVQPRSYKSLSDAVQAIEGE